LSCPPIRKIFRSLIAESVVTRLSCAIKAKPFGRYAALTAIASPLREAIEAGKMPGEYDLPVVTEKKTTLRGYFSGE
jgi:hypothetical protein